MTDETTHQPDDDLPPKPPIEDPMPSDEELERMPEPGELDVPDDEVMPPDEAAEDPTVDDEEHDDDEG